MQRGVAQACGEMGPRPEQEEKERTAQGTAEATRAQQVARERAAEGAAPVRSQEGLRVSLNSTATA